MLPAMIRRRLLINHILKQESNMRSRRALLYMPGDDQRKIEKGAELGADCICMDMEDGVAPDRKLDARLLIKKALPTIDFGPSEKLVRINAVGSGLEEDDLRTALAGEPDGIVIPKVEREDQIQWANRIIGEFYQTRHLDKQIALFAIIETARGIVNLAQIASASPHLQVLAFGAEDLAGDMGAVRTKEGWEIFYARSAVVLHAAAYNLQALDMVYVDLNDLDGLRSEAFQAAQMGFSGKQVIHPKQIGPVQEAFTPTEAEIQYARRVLEAFEEHKQLGKGVFTIDGKMIEAPIIKTAENVLSRARAAGKLL
jgi:citrate lyase beta subunit